MRTVSSTGTVIETDDSLPTPRAGINAQIAPEHEHMHYTCLYMNTYYPHTCTHRVRPNECLLPMKQIRGNSK